MLSDFSEEAKKLARQGFRVFPCRLGEKVPATAHGCKDATCDPDKIGALFRPGQNVAIATGDGLFVIDFDEIDGPDKFEDRHGQLPTTVMVETPRGGWHYYFRTKTSVKNSQSKVADKVDVRGAGGYVVSPPSTVNGKAYKWVIGLSPSEIEVAEAPAWLLNIVAPSETPASASAPAAGDTSVVERCRKYMAKLPPAISGRGGHNQTLEAAAICFRFGLSESDAWTLLNEYNSICQPPWTEKELRHKLHDAYKLVQSAGDAGVMADGRQPRPAQRQQSRATETGNTPADVRPCTDLGNAERLIDQHGTDLRYCPGIGWLAYCGTHWERDNNGEVYRRAAQTVRAINGEAARCNDDDLRKSLQRLAAASESESLKRIDTLAQNDIRVAIRAEQLDRDKVLFNVLNGTINLATGELLPHRREDLITRVAPVTFDLDAQCPLFDAFLARILPDEPKREFVMRLLGYSMTGAISDQVFPVFYGGGQNGKSTLLDLVCEMFGDYAGTAPDSLLAMKHNQEHPTELACLMGLRLVVASETESGAKLRVQLVKKLTGDARIKARKMRQDYFEFDRTHKFIMATNHKPEVNEDTEAVWRRLRLVPFNVSIPKSEQDTHLHEKLMAESPGILNRLVAASLTWQNNGLSEPPEVLAATKEYRDESQPIKGWLDDRCIVDARLWAKSSVLWQSYVDHCECAREKTMPQRAFLDALRVHGFVAERTHSGRGWKGLGLQLEDTVFSSA